ncbi:MAG: FlgD immunoglobulin-like domain containing protein [Candidatus Krumholzibacteriia bacterium]
MTRFLLAALLAALAASGAVAEPGATRVPLGILVTNWDCDPCAPANQALDAWYPGVGDRFALIRVHCWWPGPYDPIYRDNVEQSEYLIYDTPNGPDSAPHLWVDNLVNGGTYAELMVGYLEDRALVPAPLAIGLDWDAATEVLTATVDVLDPLPPGEYRLFVAVTEDPVAAQGSNGEPFHNQAFRHLYPSVGGRLVAPEAGQQVLAVSAPLSARWNHDQLRLTAYVQSRDTGEVQNAATIRLSDLVTAAAPDLAPAGLDLAAFPNPFNPLTHLRFDLPTATRVTLRIHDLRGRAVRTLVDSDQAAGRHDVAWDGRDRQGGLLPSGVYLVQLRVGGTVASRKLTLTR